MGRLSGRAGLQGGSALLFLSLLFCLSGCGIKAPAPAKGSPPPERREFPGAEPRLKARPAPEPESPPAPEAFVLISDYLPDIRIDLRYAGEDNFTGQVIYRFSGACLRYGTVQKLAAAQEALRAEGYSLLIWDAFRPAEAQFRLWEVCPDPVYVANPERGFSSHSRGNTVDLTLVLADGAPVEMPTGFDDFSPRADRDYSDIAEPAASNARLLESVMTECGFQPYFGEWWHFSDTDSYPVETAFVPD